MVIVRYRNSTLVLEKKNKLNDSDWPDSIRVNNKTLLHSCIKTMSQHGKSCTKSHNSKTLFVKKINHKIMTASQTIYSW